MDIDVNGKTMTARLMLSAEAIHTRVQQLAQQINNDYPKDEPLVVLIVLHGAILFAADLVRGLSMPTVIETTRLKSYEGTQSSGHIELVTAIPSGIHGKQVLIVEDIIDSGRSIAFLLPKVKEAGAKSIRIAALLDKPDAHESSVKADYAGFEIGKHFVIGYGLDLDGRFRNLPYIAELV
jgi:hypoxanthine phosphoribosyltransferase